jgi:glycosyltransferase involved in cell wall biosynthesis
MLENVADAAYVFFDPDRKSYRNLNQKYARLLLSGGASIDTMGLSDPSGSHVHSIDRLPLRSRFVLLWLLRFPHMMLRSLERVRLHSGGLLASVIDWLQCKVMSAKQRQARIDSSGYRRPYLPIDMACGDDFEFLDGDVLFAGGAGWLHGNIQCVRTLRARASICFVLFCHDIIPLLFPQFYKEHDVEGFRRYFEVAAEVSDLIIFSTQTGSQHARDYCEERKLQIGATAVGSLGADALQKFTRRGELPIGLVPGKFVLYVSTIEPRKGHALLYNVWLNLLKEGIPQAFGYKLVFVGRVGWNMSKFFDQLRTASEGSETLELLTDVDDAALAALYEGAAFCVYPSVYEGYGLPVVEAFSYGRALVCSNGGALAEVAGPFALCLDPGDEEAWFRVLRNWITDPQQYRAYELAVKDHFSHPTWAEASQRIYLLSQSAVRRSDEPSS